MTPVEMREFALRVAVRTKHGPGGMGGRGECESDCIKCEADRVIVAINETLPPTRRCIEMLGRHRCMLDDGHDGHHNATGRDGTEYSWGRPR